jgi:CBS domain-containing protein
MCDHRIHQISGNTLQLMMSIELGPVSKFMNKNVKTATMDQTIYAISKTMYENSIGSVVIIKRTHYDTEPVGIITERDIIRSIGSSELFSSQVSIRTLMSSPPITITTTRSITDAIETMQSTNIRRLPVIDDKGKMVGILTDKHVLKAISKNQTLGTNMLNDHVPLEDQTRYGRFIEGVVWR